MSAILGLSVFAGLGFLLAWKGMVPVLGRGPGREDAARRAAALQASVFEAEMRGKR